MADKKTPEDAEAEWWKEDAERLNRMGELARKMGIVRGEPNPEPPDLNDDGTEKEENSSQGEANKGSRQASPKKASESRKTRDKTSKEKKDRPQE